MRQHEAAQGFIYLCLDVLQGWRLHSLSGHPGAVILTVLVEKLLLISSLNLFCLCVCLLLYIVSLCTTEESGWLFCLNNCLITVGLAVNVPPLALPSPG